MFFTKETHLFSNTLKKSQKVGVVSDWCTVSRPCAEWGHEFAGVRYSMGSSHWRPCSVRVPSIFTDKCRVLNNKKRNWGRRGAPPLPTLCASAHDSVTNKRRWLKEKYLSVRRGLLPGGCYQHPVFVLLLTSLWQSKHFTATDSRSCKSKWGEREETVWRCRITETNSSVFSHQNRAIPENRGIQKIEIQFFSVENNSMCMSFGKKLDTLKVTIKMSKLIDNACLW